MLSLLEILLVLGAIALLVGVVKRGTSPVAVLATIGVVVVLAGIFLFTLTFAFERVEPVAHHASAVMRTDQVITQDSGARLAVADDSQSKEVAPPRREQPVDAVPEESPAPERPTWIAAPSEFADGVFQTTTHVGPYTSVEECNREMRLRLRQIASENIDLSLGSGAASRVRVDDVFLMKHSRYWVEPIDHAEFGKMYNLYAQLRFDDKDWTVIRERFRETIVTERLAGLAAGGTTLLVALGTLLGYLKLDTYTKGYYTTRLRAAAGAVAAAVMIAGGMTVSALFF